ncbi:phosphoribosylanthranilate isomerase [candidate division KSB1 bacterium]|nr:MAG: phosphoribosylanthranilate isomerase [candidate division KSB1 bacterium]MBC6949919.1 phosphoribosylanthranilate isomerase [candidate division KSB1 bacterium]MCE7941833.1 phosphoribosylanthranilate isomerase [Chlorobi bacterium CHB1]MDL1876609.1 phosphoribosylanthranilate isomerase [Cytophagia bacterium CHB2]
MLNNGFHPRVKICCISSLAEARLAIQFGASALGLVSEMPSGPGVISEKVIAEIAAYVPPGVSSFLLTSKQSAKEIIAQQRRCGTNTIQLVDELLKGSYADLRTALPGIKLVQVIHVTGENSIAEAERVALHVDAILLDSGNPNLAVKELGGTGRTHNWRISREIRQSIDVPLFLAGGLSADNVRAAIEEVAPFGLDICSGVRTNGRLDENKLARFFESVRNLA